MKDLNLEVLTRVKPIINGVLLMLLKLVDELSNFAIKCFAIGLSLTLA